MGPSGTDAQVHTALAAIRASLTMTAELIDVLAASGVPDQQLAWAHARIDQLNAAVDQIAATHGDTEHPLARAQR